MGDMDMITILRHKRHDWMNQIQLIQGYASLNKKENLLGQLEKLKNEAEQERRLLSCGADQFALWLMTFNWKEELYRIEFHLEEDIDLSRHDKTIMAYVQRMVKLLKDHQSQDELYEGTVHVYAGFQPNTYHISWEWNGPFQEAVHLKDQLEDEGFIATVFDTTELSVEMTIE